MSKRIKHRPGRPLFVSGRKVEEQIVKAMTEAQLSCACLARNYADAIAAGKVPVPATPAAALRSLAHAFQEAARETDDEVARERAEPRLLVLPGLPQ